MKTILITGINGFLGSNLAQTLKSDYCIIGLECTIDNLFRISKDHFKVYSSEMNLEDIFIENEIFAIIHAATVYPRSNESMEMLINSNVLLPVRLYELANKHNTELFFNTDSFFNNQAYNYSYLSKYTLTKKQVLEWLQLIQSSCRLINMKVYHMYGPNDSANKFIPQILGRLINKEPIIDTTLAEQTRDFIYIEDVVSAYRLVIEKSNDLKSQYIEFEVGTGIETTIREFLIQIKEITKSTSAFNFGGLDYRLNEIMRSKANNVALRNLGWKPKYNIFTGISKLLGIENK